MARGVIYYIANNPHEVTFDESDYYDHLEALGADYVKNETKQDSEIPLEYLQKQLMKLGAVTGYGQIDGQFTFSFCFSDADSARRLYFEPKLIKLKEQVAALTLEDVIHTSPSLDFILENQYGDLIECENISSTAMSMDDFIRNMESGVTYYVYERVILMH